jgi:hypothetical protein
MSVWDLPDDPAPHLEVTTVPPSIPLDPVKPLSVLEQMRHAQELNLVQNYLLVTVETDPNDLSVAVDLSDSDDNLVHSIWQANMSDAEDTPGMPGTPQSPTDPTDLSDSDTPLEGQRESTTNDTDNIESLIARINAKLHTHHQSNPPVKSIQSPENPKLTKRYYMCVDCNELHTDTEDDEDDDEDDEDDFGEDY